MAIQASEPRWLDLTLGAQDNVGARNASCWRPVELFSASHADAELKDVIGPCRIGNASS